ncbi:HAD family hydrolase [Thalassobacillus hwangdonensis]|uniref:HAD family hydrolase n=1 Tax=Thalassobacillus hwangdonensis TaxID=546108 RepID=A0ABW3L4B5_9BACI
MIKLFITDLDGTLLGQDHYINDKDVEAIKKLAEEGVDFAVATGRMDGDIVEVLKKTGLKGHRISQNGAFVYDRSDKNIHSNTFETEVAKRVYADILEEPLVTTITTADDSYSHEKNEWIDMMSKQLFHDVIVDPELAEQLGVSIIPSKLTAHGKENEVMALQKRIEENYGDELDCFVSHETCVDLMPKNINKANGIKALIEHIGLKPEEIAVIGDSFNDVSMFALTQNSFAMSTAHEDVKAKADHVVTHVHEAIEILYKKYSVV